MPIWHQSPKLTPRYFLETPRLFGYPKALLKRAVYQYPALAFRYVMELLYRLHLIHKNPNPKIEYSTHSEPHRPALRATHSII